MSIYAPKYYREFACVADKCTHSCCIGWDVYIDERTAKKYGALQSAYADKIRESICGGDEPMFRMCADGRCPHLDSNGLCKIILNCGEEYLSDICREHPRFYNESSRGVEVGLGMACEEAARIILSSDNYRDFVVVGESCADIEVTEFDAIAEVEKVLEILSDEDNIYPERLTILHEKYEVSPSKIADSQWRKLLEDLEYLDEKHKKMFLVYSSDIATQGESDKLCERALAYFVYRHCASAQEEADFQTSLGLALFLERLFASIIQKEGINELLAATRVARIISEELEYSEENTDLIRQEFCF